MDARAALAKYAEREFEKRFLFEHNGEVTLLHRLPDASNFYGSKGKTKTKQPADYLGMTDEGLILCEVKSTTSAKRFSFSGKFQPLQIGWIKKAGLLNPRVYMVYIFSEYHNEWYRVPQHTAARLISEGSSLKFEEMKEYFPWRILGLDY